MTLETSKGKRYEVDWINGPMMTNKLVTMRMPDERPLSEIATELEGLAWMERRDEAYSDKRWGATKLVGIYRDGDRVTASFALEG